jgi:hypothetical protein
MPKDGGDTVYDAPLLASGRLGRTRRLVFVPRSGRMPELAYNDQGGVLVAWQKLGRPRVNVPFPVKVVFCPPGHRCEPPRTVELGPSGPHQNGFMAAALTDQNTIVIACDAQIDSRGFPTDAGVWTTVSRNGGPFSVEQEISPTGNGPSLAAFGQDKVVLSYTPPRSAPAAPWSAPAIATLAPGDQKFRPAGQYPGTSTGDVPFVLSGGGSNTFATYWATFDGHSDDARIGVGGSSGIGTPHSFRHLTFPNIALDHHGDTLVAWSHARKVILEIGRQTAPTG